MWFDFNGFIFIQIVEIIQNGIILFIMLLSMIPVWIYDLLPTSLILRFMTSSSASKSFKTDVIGVYNVLQKIFLIGNTLPMALSVCFFDSCHFLFITKQLQKNDNNS